MTTESNEEVDEVEGDEDDVEAPEEIDLKDRYVDPSSGAAPQPGSVAVATGDVYENPDDVPLTVAPGFQGLDAQNEEEAQVPDDSLAALPEQGGGPVYPVEDNDDEDRPRYDPEEVQEQLDAYEETAKAEAEAQAEGEDDTPPDEGGDDSGDEGAGTQDDSQEDGDDRAPAPEASYDDLLDQSIPKVLEYVDAHPDEREAVLAAEQTREEPRSTLVAQLQG